MRSIRLLTRVSLKLALVLALCAGAGCARLLLRGPVPAAAFFPRDACKPPMVWAHRAQTWAGAERPSGEAVAQALADGFCGLELDIFYTPEDEFLVGHDAAEARAAGLSLAALWRRHGSDAPYWWLDLKNLDSENLPKAAARLSEIARAQPSPPWIVVETTRHRLLRRFGELAPEARAMHWLEPRSDAGDVVRLAGMALLLLWHDPDAVSMKIENFELLPAVFLQNRIVMVFTSDDGARIRRAFARGAHVVLSDVRPKGLALAPAD